MRNIISSKFESQVLKGEIVCVYFWAENCKKCKLLGTRIESLILKKGVSLIKIDVAVEQDLALRYDVLGLPTIIFFWNGREELRLHAENMVMEEVEKACDKLLKLKNKL